MTLLRRRLRQGIPSERRDMNDWRYAQYTLETAADWGRAVRFWIRHNKPVEAGFHARKAAHWGLKLLGREEA